MNIQSQYDELRRAKHEFNNSLLSIKYMLDDKSAVPRDKVEQIKTYIDTISPEREASEPKAMVTPSLSLIEDLSIKSIIIEKTFYASSMGKDLTINVQNKIPLTKDGPEINKILGIALNNAIEAVKSPSDEISLTASFDDGFLAFTIVNPIAKDSQLNPGDVTTDGFSTKGTEHGLGLAIARQIVARHDNFSLDIEIDQGIFTVSLFVQHQNENN